MLKLPLLVPEALLGFALVDRKQEAKECCEVDSETTETYGSTPQYGQMRPPQVQVSEDLEIYREVCRFPQASFVVRIGLRDCGNAVPTSLLRPYSLLTRTEIVHDLRRWICRRGTHGQS